MEEIVESAWYVTEGGQRFLVHTIQEYVHAGSFANPNARIPGMKRLELDDGEKLNYVDADTVRFVHRGQATLKRVA